MPKVFLIFPLVSLLFLVNCSKDKFSKEPPKLSDDELYTILETTEERDLTPYWIEAEKREMIFIKLIAHDKSGTVLKLFMNERLSEEAVKRYILFKLKDPSKLSHAEKGILFYQSAGYQLTEAVPLMFKALEDEPSLNAHIAAAYAFGRLKAQESRPLLEKNLNPEYRASLGSGSPFDESKRDELLKASKEALQALEEE